MTRILNGDHIPLDRPLCASCGQDRPLLDALADNNRVAAVGLICRACDAVTVLRVVLDPFTSAAA